VLQNIIFVVRQIFTDQLFLPHEGGHKSLFHEKLHLLSIANVFNFHKISRRRYVAMVWIQLLSCFGIQKSLSKKTIF